MAWLTPGLTDSYVPADVALVCRETTISGVNGGRFSYCNSLLHSNCILIAIPFVRAGRRGRRDGVTRINNNNQASMAWLTPGLTDSYVPADVALVCRETTISGVNGGRFWLAW